MNQQPLNQTYIISDYGYRVALPKSLPALVRDEIAAKGLEYTDDLYHAIFNIMYNGITEQIGIMAYSCRYKGNKVYTLAELTAIAATNH